MPRCFIFLWSSPSHYISIFFHNHMKVKTEGGTNEGRNREARSIIEQVGLKIDLWLAKVQESIEFFQRILVRIEAVGPPPIGTHLLMGGNAKDKLQNMLRNLSEDRVSVALGMAYKN